MKKLLPIIIISLFTNNVIAQPPHPQGSTIHNPELDKFVGTWMWSSGNESIKLVFQKQLVHFPSPLDYDEERLVGWHHYIKNGITQQNSLPNVGMQFSWDHPERVSLFGSTTVPDEIYFIKFWDYHKNKKCELYFKMLPNSITQASWKLVNPRGIKFGNADFSFSFPENLVFTKQ